MTRLVVLLVLTALAIGVSLALQRRRPEAPSAPSYRAPTQVDRSDFAHADVARLVVVFTSATCDSCAAAWEIVSKLGTTAVATQELEVQASAALHKRYKIDGVPTTLVVDDQGVVEHSYFGPLDVDQLKIDVAGTKPS